MPVILKSYEAPSLNRYAIHLNQSEVDKQFIFYSFLGEK